MLNEEIERAADCLLYGNPADKSDFGVPDPEGIFDSDVDERVCRILRDLVSRVYEEAVQVCAIAAERSAADCGSVLTTDYNYRLGRRDAAVACTSALRDLKDSLTVEPAHA